jgi:hypothetical protein
VEAKKAVNEYRSAFSTFEFELPGTTPKPCFMKHSFYDHVTLDHLVEQTELLHQMGLSHAVLSSRWLESNNRPAKAHTRMLPGGRQVYGGFGRYPLWLIFPYLSERNFVKRRVHIKDVQKWGPSNLHRACAAMLLMTLMSRLALALSMQGSGSTFMSC